MKKISFKKDFNIRFLASLSGVFLLLSSSAVFAQSSELKSAKVDASTSVDKILDLKNQKLTEAEKEKLEIDLKRDALKKIISLTKLEATEAVANLNEVKDLDPEILIIRDNVLEYLEAILSTISKDAKDADDLDDLNALNKLTDHLIGLRGADFDINLRRALEIGLLYQNGKAIKTTDQRFIKINGQIKKSDAYKANSEKIDSILKDALKFIKEAKAIDKKVSDYFISTNEDLILDAKDKNSTSTESTTSIQRVQVDSATATIQIATSSTTTAPIEGIKTDIKELVQKSLNNLKSAYKDFIKIVAIIS